MATETPSTAIWTVDQSHSEVHFKVKHLMVSTVTGSFGSYDANMETTGDSLEGAKISFSADIDSISTGNEQRDGHLKSGDFFDAASHPQLTFVSTGFTKKSGDEYTLTGDLTIRGTTKPITLDVEYGGQMVDFYGNTKAGFEISGKIKRKEFGLSWDAVTEAGGVVVSDDVKLVLNIQMAKQA
nr:YceI family protein [uncultured Arsenicibacter sp.]